MQQICRQVKKESGQTVPIQIQKEVLHKLENLNSQATDLTLAQAFQLEIKTHAKTHIQRDESMRVELTFSKEEMAVIKAAQAALSHKTGGGLKETLIELANHVLKARRSTATVAVKTADNSSAAVEVPTTPKTNNKIAVASKSLTKTVTPRLKREILERDKFCQFIDLKTGKACGSRHFLEIDHIQPRFVGGNNNPKNLRVMCKSHNIYRYKAGM